MPLAWIIHSVLQRMTDIVATSLQTLFIQVCAVRLIVVSILRMIVDESYGSGQETLARYLTEGELAEYSSEKWRVRHVK